MASNHRIDLNTEYHLIYNKGKCKISYLPPNTQKVVLHHLQRDFWKPKISKCMRGD